MPDDAWFDFQRRCLKPDSDRLGTFTARRWARPVALRITWVVLSTGISAHQATLLAAATALAAAAAFAWGTPAGWLAGGLLLELWYVLDHVDGQLARGRRTASLDGTALDYLMHHFMNGLIPQALAFGLARTTGRVEWFLLGTAWSCGLLVLGVRHDVRYKAFVQRLKLVHGSLIVVGGGGGRPMPSSWPQRSFASCLSWSVQKACEMHVVAHLLSVVGLFRLAVPNFEPATAAATLIALTLPAVLLSARRVHHGLASDAAEAEFAAWYRVPAGGTLEFRDGYFYVAPATSGDTDDDAECAAGEVVRTS